MNTKIDCLYVYNKIEIQFSASVLVAYARAAFRLNQQGQSGAYTVFDIAPALLSPKSADELRKEML